VKVRSTPPSWRLKKAGLTLDPDRRNRIQRSVCRAGAGVGKALGLDPAKTNVNWRLRLRWAIRWAHPARVIATKALYELQRVGERPLCAGDHVYRRCGQGIAVIFERM